MEMKIASEIYEYIPDFKIGLIKYHNITVGESPQMLKGRLQLFQESLFFEMEDKKATDFPSIQEWRQVFKQTGKDPNRYRHSAEALYRRVQKQDYLPSIHSATDLNNFFSLQYGIPFGIYDQEKIQGDVITVRLGEDDEAYLGLNGRDNSLHRLLLSADDAGPFGTPFVDSERTAVTKNTKHAVQIVYLQPSMPLSQAEKLVTAVADMFTGINGGNSMCKVV
ncbi:phenylalanine--tRNA ligase beta subunit-related protein [Niallia sp. XMNu-256]|uniref:B3/B4 domain-containing protein n=1 Tax=Niallia sp. XMNu-256 TaxID=3082444 RepID=UPI0030D51BF6